MGLVYGPRTALEGALADSMAFVRAIGVYVSNGVGLVFLSVGADVAEHVQAIVGLTAIEGVKSMAKLPHHARHIVERDILRHANQSFNIDCVSYIVNCILSDTFERRHMVHDRRMYGWK